MEVYKWALGAQVQTFPMVSRKLSHMAAAPVDGWSYGGWGQPIANGEYEFRTLLPAVFARTEYPFIRSISLPPEPDLETRSRLIDLMCQWSFTSLNLSPIEVYHCSCLIFESVLTLPELKKLNIVDDIRRFLHTLRFLYPTNPYHNFAHAVDVLQAVYAFLEPEVVPPLAMMKRVDPTPLSPHPLPTLPFGSPWKPVPLLLGDSYFRLRPLEILAFLLATVGHDVGHPGLTAQCLANACAPIATLVYQSPLESLHYTLLAQTLRTHGLGMVLSDRDTEELMRNVIMATDMQLHAHHMRRFATELSPSKLASNSREGYLQRVLLCQAVLHAADISNPVRVFPSGVQWSCALISEWSNQARFESSHNLPATQGAWPSDMRTLEYQLKQAKGQVQFLDFATLPLFRVLEGILPKMRAFVQIGLDNREVWENRVERLSSLHHDPRDRVPRSLVPGERFPYPDGDSDSD
ncbi:HD-domain/PDEase-like protein [Dacryopinax primogenitus]|uniref:HD-domain/PDEase-like protein n=1 Tax=Dacryopinax primogenitus (strain DJM 731) TaxID=1858805 RepID=M5G134_DACPD|nr:HD-domain/PDEase-like protein [Dacryopinax primogenitus]EJU02449.1 HD-domain/PDEase-like protein [Dacryopinax primogenitus]